MISRLGLRISEAFRRTAPDPFVLAVVLTFVTAAIVLLWGSLPAPPDDAGEQSKLATLVDVWRGAPWVRAERGNIGIWAFLAFSMQMSLVLVTGHALAASRPIRRVVDAIAALPRSPAAAAATVGLVAAVAGLINWGFALVVGALLAREVGRAFVRRGVPVHYPLLAAAGYMGLLVWHGGFSGSAPLLMTKPAEAANVLPDEALAQLQGGGVPLGATLLSPMNLFVSGGLLAIIPLVLWLLAPRHAEDIRTPDRFAIADGQARSVPDAEPDAPAGLPIWLERSPWLAWLMAIAFAAAALRFLGVSGFQSIGLNEVNVAMLALGLVFHGSLGSYMRAVEEGARGCAGIIVQFPLYAGIMAMLDASGLIREFSSWLAQGAGASGTPLFTFISAAVVNFFVPSGGGQWGIQGPVALQAGLAAEVPVGKMIMSVAYGDQLTNMLQPFWALPLLAITGAKARDIVGYTAIVMLVAAAWMALGLLIF